ncbi:four helix bundle protein [Pedobacter xixiisoli]|uniref:Four helix bundle protein n=1 Tax=Pedobacter xixiisoli TaxID=1476464 RepID=A0A286A7P2_9SPHI|nr:four helix bundle protein [Pedobacter xixiisoli]SOD17909.1 four helix bundle protein [Pedobacter xixiisoli]
MHNFRQLQTWKEGMEVTKQVYLLLAKFPPSEKFGLISQISRCAVSVPSNIAEGSSRSSNKEFAHFLSIALGSLFELETQLLLSAELAIVNSIDVEPIIADLIQLQKKITVFRKTLN